MGMYASYVMVDESTASALRDAVGDEERFFELYEELTEAEHGDGEADIDKLWDGLHLLLTGASISEDKALELAGEPLSQAITGAREIAPEPYTGISTPEEVAMIASALESVDEAVTFAPIDAQQFVSRDVYPAIWDDDPAALAAELQGHFQTLRDFYRRAADRGLGVLASIG